MGNGLNFLNAAFGSSKYLPCSVQAPTRKRQTECAKSILLTSEENGIAERLIGPRSTSLATAVVQIYRSEAPAHQRWNKRSCGVACLVKDYTRRSYYIRVVDMERRTIVFDQVRPFSKEILFLPSNRITTFFYATGNIPPVSIQNAPQLLPHV